MKMLKAISFIFWSVVVIGAIAVARNWSVSKIGDPVCAGVRVLIFGLMVGSFFICLFKVFRVIRKVNPPTWLNLAYWLVSFALFIVSLQWINKEDVTSLPNYFYINYPDGGKAILALILWAVVSGCWLGFNRIVKDEK